MEYFRIICISIILNGHNDQCHSIYLFLFKVKFSIICHWIWSADRNYHWLLQGYIQMPNPHWKRQEESAPIIYYLHYSVSGALHTLDLSVPPPISPIPSRDLKRIEHWYYNLNCNINGIEWCKGSWRIERERRKLRKHQK